MNKQYCEMEPQIVAAFRGGSRSPEILAHAHTCPVCSEVLLVTESLHREMPLAEHELGMLPEPGLVWRKAQARVREQALARATRPIRLVRSCAFFVAALVVVGARFTFPVAGEWSEILLKYLGLVERIWPAALSSGAILVGFAGMLVVVGLSSWYMLQEE